MRWSIISYFNYQVRNYFELSGKNFLFLCFFLLVFFFFFHSCLPLGCTSEIHISDLKFLGCPKISFWIIKDLGLPIRSSLGQTGVFLTYCHLWYQNYITVVLEASSICHMDYPSDFILLSFPFHSMETSEISQSEIAFKMPIWLSNYVDALHNIFFLFFPVSMIWPFPALTFPNHIACVSSLRFLHF